jgi:hypothetical protein
MNGGNLNLLKDIYLTKKFKKYYPETNKNNVNTDYLILNNIPLRSIFPVKNYM